MYFISMHIESPWGSPDGQKGKQPGGGLYRAIPSDGSSSNIYSTMDQEEIDAVE